MAGSQPPDRFMGSWRMTEMELCDAECHDLIVPAFIEFDHAPMGHVQFGTGRGWLDGRVGEVVAGVRSKGIASTGGCSPHFRCVAPDLSRSTAPGARAMSS